jgi:hypothetical protein
MIGDPSQLASHVAFDPTTRLTVPSPTRINVDRPVEIIRLATNKKSYQVPPHSDVDNIPFRELSLKDNTTNQTTAINCWDTNVVYDLIDGARYAKSDCENMHFVNIMTETTAAEVGVSDSYFSSINARLFTFSTLFNNDRKDMIIEAIEAAGIDVRDDINTKNDLKIWIEACSIASYYEGESWTVNLLSYNHFLVRDIRNVIIQGKLNLAQYGLSTLVIPMQPSVERPSQSATCKQELERLRKAYPYGSR